MAEVLPSTRDCSTQYDQSMLHALEEKYLDTDHNDDYIKTAGIQIMHNLTSIKTGGVTLPQCLALNYCHIARAGDSGRLHELCRRVTELDIAENDLKDWNEIINITNQMPYLEFLNLSSNPLSCTMDLHSKPSSDVASIKRLALNNTRVPWEIVYGLVDILPGVEELHLSLNDYRNIPQPPNNKAYPQLTRLQFNENHISQWEQLCPLGKAFPQLTSLILIGNKLCGKITPEVTANFPNLSCLNLTNTCMQSWEELEGLNDFPSLVSVRLQGVPFCENIPEQERRQLSIARLGRVSRLNGSPVGDTEREDAERAFVRYYMDSEVKPARYEELIKKYGHLDRLADVNLRPKHSVKCKIRSMQDDTTEEMYISLKQSVKDLKKILAKQTGVPFTKLRLFYVDQEFAEHIGVCGYGEELKYNATMVHTLRPQDGDEFFFDRKL